jgi:hypothetical protein
MIFTVVRKSNENFLYIAVAMKFRDCALQPEY